MAGTHRHGGLDLSQRMPIDRVLHPLRLFAAHKLAGAGLLMLATIAAVIWANSPWHHGYHHLLETPVTVAVGPLKLTKSLHHLINDGLMSVFFFLVGLEIKRELLVGELSSPRKAVLPAIAAVGGMAIPAIVYVAVAGDGPAADGWGIPMATDIAFALGVLAVLGDRVPPGLRVLLTALAIVDDIGAVLVIAIFYTEQIATGDLLIGLVGVGVSATMNRLGVRDSLAYFIVGLLVWLAFLQSGVHATIAALLMAFTIPAGTRIDGRKLTEKLETALEELRKLDPEGRGLNSPERQHLLDEVAAIRQAAAAPLQDLEHAIVGLVTFAILPLFALANAGVSLDGVGLETLGGGVALGITLGLLVGKPVGILGFSWLAVKLGLTQLPEGVRFVQVLGVGLLGAIGFTMALFIGGLAFSDPASLAATKVSILVASIVAGVAGLVVLRASSTRA